MQVSSYHINRQIRRTITSGGEGSAAKGVVERGGRGVGGSAAEARGAGGLEAAEVAVREAWKKGDVGRGGEGA